jgi:hypothetical protein
MLVRYGIPSALFACLGTIVGVILYRFAEKKTYIEEEWEDLEPGPGINRVSKGG